jgi:hypothetical protein
MVIKTKIEKPSIFEGLVRNSIIFYLILIILGYITTAGYYRIFDIDVYDFFAVEDYLNVVFKNLLLIGIITISYIVIGSILVLYVRIKAKSDALNEDVLLEGKKEDIKSSRKFFKILFIISVFLMLASLIIYLVTKKLTFLSGLVLSFFPLLISGSWVLLIDLNQSGLYKISTPQRFLLVLLLISVYFNFYFYYIKGVSLYVSKSNYQKMTFQFNSGKSITTSDSTLYLGSSKDYIFLYSKSDKKAFIYNKSTVTSIESESKKKK